MFSTTTERSGKSSTASSNDNKHQITPIIDRLLNNPLNFQQARHPDKVTLIPSTYITFKSSKNDKRSKPKDLQTPLKSTEAKERQEVISTMVRPKSMAEAVALYTGKKYLSKKEKKLLNPKKVKKEDKIGQIAEDNLSKNNEEEELGLPLSDTEYVGELNVNEDLQLVNKDTSGDDEEKEEEEEEEEDSSKNETPAAEQEDSEEDADFQTAEEDSEQSSEQSSEEDNSSDDDEFSSEELEDPKQLKQDLKNDLLDNNTDESDSEEILEKETLETEQTDKLNLKIKETPPTSPDDDIDLITGSLVRTKYDDDEFYAMDEMYNDRGSNGSKRIFKSWREFKTRKVPVGLLNHGVTCYMNSAVQALCHIPALLHYLVDVHNDKKGKIVPSDSVTKALADTIAKMYRLDNKGDKQVLHINPKRLISRLEDINCMMSQWQQEDSHEYFMSLMSRLQEDSTPKGTKLNQSIIYDIFGGLLSQTVTCKNCGHISTTEQEFYDLSLGLDSHKKRNSSILDPQQLFELKNQIEAAKSTKSDSKQQLSEFLRQKILQAQEARRSRSGTPEANDDSEKKSPSPSPLPLEDSQQPSQQQQQQQQPQQLPRAATVTPPQLNPIPATKYSIENSLRDFFCPELLKVNTKEKSGYVCENCKKTTNAIKISTIERAPETLAIHLKRFKFNGSASMKLKNNVSYPDTLDITEFTTTMDKPTKYKLSSVIVHQGRSVSSGHYIAHCKQPDGSWASYDDEYINRIKPRDALGDESAYVLIYNRLSHKSVQIPDNNNDDNDNNASERASAGVVSNGVASSPIGGKRKRDDNSHNINNRLVNSYGKKNKRRRNGGRLL